MGSVFDRKVVLTWQIWLLVKSPYKLIKLGNFQMSITSSKISFGTQFKAHIGANHAARHLHLKKFEKEQNKKKSQGVLRSTVCQYSSSQAPSTFCNRPAQKHQKLYTLCTVVYSFATLDSRTNGPGSETVSLKVDSISAQLRTDPTVTNEAGIGYPPGSSN